jgi:hypothetical protein
LIGQVGLFLGLQYRVFAGHQNYAYFVLSVHRVFIQVQMALIGLAARRQLITLGLVFVGHPKLVCFVQLVMMAIIGL